MIPESESRQKKVSEEVEEGGDGVEGQGRGDYGGGFMSERLAGRLWLDQVAHMCH